MTPWNKGLTARTDARVAKSARKLSASLKGTRRRGFWKTGDGVASALRLAQMAHEKAQADEMVAEGYEVFTPTVVCDRIAIKDGKIYFVEFKRPGQELRAGQRRIQGLVPDRYIIRYAEIKRAAGSTGTAAES